MTTANATKKLIKAGFEIKISGAFINARKGNHAIELIANGGDMAGNVATIRVRSINDNDDSQSDYSAGVFCDTVTQAIKIAN